MLNPPSMRMPLADPSRLLQARARRTRCSTRKLRAVVPCRAACAAALRKHYAELRNDTLRLLDSLSAWLLAWFAYPLSSCCMNSGTPWPCVVSAAR